jgi:hypothetical protein
MRCPQYRASSSMSQTSAMRMVDSKKSGQRYRQAELARVGHVSRARLTQIMDLNLLAPDIQERVLFLDSIEPHGRLPLGKEVRAIAALADWADQRSSWISYTELRKLG